MAVIGGFRSDLSITCMIDGYFGNVSAGVLFFQGAFHYAKLTGQRSVGIPE